MSFLRSLTFISPFFRVSPSFGLRTREEEHGGPRLAPVLVGMAAMDPARGGLVSQDLEKLRCVAAFKMTSF